MKRLAGQYEDSLNAQGVYVYWLSRYVDRETLFGTRITDACF